MEISTLNSNKEDKEIETININQQLKENLILS
jgi:hypothetical protein